uniref:Uncharacterized protein n=1 Tax=Anopheles epiroticus TaxID=199890 RepID=A0A182PG11_9DIPT
MAEVQELQEIVSQIQKPESTIKCAIDGIDFEKLTALCDLPGAPENVQQLITPSVVKLREAATQDDRIAITEDIMKILIEKLASFVTLEEYVWLVRTTVALQLLKGLPMKISSLIQTVAKCLREDIPLEGVNLLHVIKKLAIANSPLLYYTAVALLFAGLERITQRFQPIETMYRVYGMDDFLHHLEVLDIPQLQQLCTNLQNVYQLLKLLSLYQNMVIMRHADKQPKDLEEEHKGFAQSLCATDSQINRVRQWLESLIGVVQPYGRGEHEEDFLILEDLIQLDIIPLFDAWDAHLEMM